MTSFCSDIVLNVFKVNIKDIKDITQLTFTCSKTMIKAREQDVNYVQS